jgi:hypothetical protein
VSAPSPRKDPKESPSAARPLSIVDRARVPEPPPTMSMSRHLRAGLVFFVIMILFAGVAYPLGIATLGWGLHSGPSTTPVASNTTSAPSNNSSGNSTTNATVAFSESRVPSAPGAADRPWGTFTDAAPRPQTYVYLSTLRSPGPTAWDPSSARGVVADGHAIAR